MDNFIDNNPIISGIILIIIGAWLLVYQIESLKKQKDNKHKTVLLKTANMNMIGLIVLFIIGGLIIIFKA
ncbi:MULTISPECIES: hypothetical protein [Tenacibaculum]|uniref:hypothetical protein n=1 Tax=Tenacibaculum TaxID=104267 RepID=UPI000895A9E5|nr:hypothetical protein [Tenacibaculum sp. MAR_2010_89]SED98941.1 hypothetical protein SAMN04487765_1025 [Tenacibaculum sp. MAR_2010_89]